MYAILHPAPPRRTRESRGRLARLALVALPLLTGCKPTPPAPTALPPVEVSVSRPLTQTVSDSLEFTGTTAALEQVEIRARVTGYLQSVHYQPRAVVEPNELLFTIDPRPFQNVLDSALGSEAALQAQLIKAQSDLEKIERLVRQGAASQDELTTNLASRDSLVGQIAQAQAEIAAARLNLDFCTVEAPSHGRVARNEIDPGNIVTADVTLLTTLVNDDALYAYFNVSERDALVIRDQTHQRLAAQGKTFRDQPPLAEIAPPAYLGLMTETGYPHAGQIDYGAPAVDPGTGTIELRARFPNDDELLLPGLFVRLRVPISQPYEALTVTERALGSDQGQRYVLVVNEQNVAEYRPVQVGTLHEGLRVITAGLQPTDWVIVNGVQRVRPGATVKPNQVAMPTAPAGASAGRHAGAAAASAPATDDAAP